MMRLKQKRKGEGRKKRTSDCPPFSLNILKEKIIFMATKLLEKIEGYDWHNYDKKQGINPSGDDILSNLVVESVENLILDGYSDSSIYDILYNTYGMNSWCVRFIVRKAHSTLLKKQEKQEENLLKKQNMRLFKLYRSALEREDHKSALSILQEVNRLNKLYVNKIEISSDAFVLDLGLSDTTKKDNGEDNQQNN